jgi:hypothetical protein
MKGYLTLILAWAISGSVVSQTKADPGPEKKLKGIYLEASAGVSFPIGNSYPSIDTKNDNSGYAGTGFLFQLNGDWPGSHDLGLGFQYDFQNNPIKSSARNLIPEGTDTLPLGSGSWSNHYLLIGPVFVKELHKFQISARVVVGLVLATGPPFRYYDPVNMKSANGTGVGFGYSLNAGFGYAVSKRVSLKVNAGYLGGTPKFSTSVGTHIVGVDTSGIYIWSGKTDISIKKIISALSLSAGAVIKL